MPKWVKVNSYSEQLCEKFAKLSRRLVTTYQDVAEEQLTQKSRTAFVWPVIACPGTFYLGNLLSPFASVPQYENVGRLTFCNNICTEIERHSASFSLYQLLLNTPINNTCSSSIYPLQIMWNGIFIHYRSLSRRINIVA